MTYLSKRYNTKQAGDEDANGSGKLNGTWSGQDTYMHCTGKLIGSMT